jgi:glycosyltransferase involved in cell wall biosynthesis
MAHAALWRLERHLEEVNFAALDLSTDETPGLETIQTEPADWRDRANLVMVRTDLLRSILLDPNQNWFRSLWTSTPDPRRGMSVVGSPHASPPARRDAIDALRRLFDALASSPYAQARALPRRWKSPGTLERQYLSLRARSTVGVDAPIAPRSADRRGRNVAFVLPWFEFGGVERVTRRVAKELKERGFRPHLAIWNGARAPGLLGSIEPFESLSFLDDPASNAWSGEAPFLGTDLPAWGRRPDQQGLGIGLLVGMDAVIFTHALAANAIAGRLRRLDIPTLNYLHVTDLTEFGRPVGHTIGALAYDHAFDRVVACSDTLAAWLEGMGVPAPKILTVPNGPGIAIDPARAEASAAAKALRAGPLRVLFMGRLDRQKGMERVLAVARHFEAHGRRDVEFRFVGAGLVDGGAADPRSAPNVDWRPKTLNDDELASHYEWADVMLLLSHWEGLPLSIAEAQTFGVVPIATRVGAMEELIAHGATGFLVDSPDAVHAAIAALQALAHDRTPLAAVAQAANKSASERAWADAIRPLMEYMEERLKTRRFPALKSAAPARPGRAATRREERVNP